MGRSKTGGKYLTPETLWDFFIAYKEDVKANPFVRVEQKKGMVNIPKGATEKQIQAAMSATVELPLQRPLTFDGFRNYLYTNGSVKRFDDYYYNNHGDYSAFIDVCGRIRSEIRQDQIEGGMCMIYNPSITQRLNGLVEKSEVKVENIELTMNLK